MAFAADQFIVDRPSEQDDDHQGRTVIAGYHWFSDWGRDTMIALPGLTMVTGRHKLAADILRTFNKYVNQGMLPNRFPDIGQIPEYNTVDATLWFFEAVRAYYEFTNDQDLVAELYPSLEDIVSWHEKGTRYNIHVDPNDGLVYAGEEGVQLTWMDAKVDDWVVTPRAGKPVEINALWYNAQRSMAGFAELLGMDGSVYVEMAEKVQANFYRYWNQALGYYFDVLDTPNGDDPSLRPNQIFAVSLYHSPLEYHHQKAVVDACTEHLLTPFGLRSLAPHEKEYTSIYGGDRYKRDAAYHQGTVWGWLIGPYIQAHLKVYQDTSKAQEILTNFISQLPEFGVGSIGEIFDGDAPHEPRGCIAQAWSVAEALRAVYLLEKFNE
jgi:predicted glycogen debranching enzyme